VDLEGLYAPGFGRPEALSSGSAGYAHAQAAAGLWSPNADRFAGAVLLAEMLGWCAPEVTQAAWGESYFDPQEMQQDSARYQALLAALQRHWGDAVARLFARAWHSETLADCPTFGEWLVALPGQPAAEQRTASTVPSPSLPAAPPLAEATAPAADETAADMAAAKVRALMQAAAYQEEQRDLESALKLYRQALGLAQGDPALRSLAREIELTIADVERRLRAAQTFAGPPMVTPPAPVSQPVAAISAKSALQMAELARRGEGRVHQVAFSPDGRTLAVASTISGASFSVEKLVAVRFLPGNAPVLSMARSPDGRLLASASDDGTVSDWFTPLVKIVCYWSAGWPIGFTHLPSVLTYSRELRPPARTRRR